MMPDCDLAMEYARHGYPVDTHTLWFDTRRQSDAEPVEGVEEPRVGAEEPVEEVKEPRVGVKEPREGSEEPRVGVKEPRARARFKPLLF